MQTRNICAQGLAACRKREVSASLCLEGNLPAAAGWLLAPQYLRRGNVAWCRL